MTIPGNGPPDDRGRNRQNLIALAVLVGLLLGGVWLFTTLRTYAKIEECVEAGRHNCVPEPQ